MHGCGCVQYSVEASSLVPNIPLLSHMSFQTGVDPLPRVKREVRRAMRGGEGGGAGGGQVKIGIKAIRAT